MNFNKNAVNQMKKEDSKFGEKNKQTSMTPHRKTKNPPSYSRMTPQDLLNYDEE